MRELNHNDVETREAGEQWLADDGFTLEPGKAWTKKAEGFLWEGVIETKGDGQLTVTTWKQMKL